MKKWITYMMMLTAATFTACTEDFNTDIAKPQQWEQEKAKTIGFKAESVGAIDLNKVTTETVKVCTLTPPTLTEGSVSEYRLYLNDKISIAIDSLGQVKTGALQDSLVSLYGRRPVARNVRAHLYAFVTVGSQTLRSDSLIVPLTLTPRARFISPTYSLLLWKKGATNPTIIKFNHTGDVYENPVFTLVTKVEAGTEWAIGSKKHTSPIEQEDAEEGTGLLGNATEGNDAVEGTLVPEGKRMKFKSAGWTKIELNMQDYTYKVTAMGNASPNLYVPGNHQSWAPATAPALYSADFTNYAGFVALNGEFKFTSEQTWNGTNYGAGAKDGLLSTDSKAGNLKVDKGFYLLRVNTSSLTWSAALIKTFGLIGDATTGGWTTSTPMTYNAAKGTYTATVTLKDGELKFRANDAWDISMGGALDNLTFDGANIKVKAGTYKITLNLSNPSKYTCTMEKQGEAGS